MGVVVAATAQHEQRSQRLHGRLGGASHGGNKERSKRDAQRGQAQGLHGEISSEGIRAEESFGGCRSKEEARRSTYSARRSRSTGRAHGVVTSRKVRNSVHFGVCRIFDKILTDRQTA